jgi:hypothetical protein
MDGLGQELQRTSFHRPHRHRNIAEAGDEDDGQIDVGVREFLLKIQPTQVRQAYIEHDAAPGRRCASRRESRARM